MCGCADSGLLGLLGMARVGLNWIGWLGLFCDCSGSLRQAWVGLGLLELAIVSSG